MEPPDIQDAFKRLMRSLGNGADAVAGLEEIVEAVKDVVGREPASALDSLFDAIMASDPKS